MNIINKMKSTLVLGLLLSSFGIFAQENPVVTNGQTVDQIAPKQQLDIRVVTFKNNLEEDMVMLLELNEEDSQAVAAALKNAKVCVNGHAIAAGKSIALPIKNNSYVVQVILPEAGLAPITKMKKILSWFKEFAVTFTATVPEDTNEVEILYPIIAKEEEWNKNIFTRIGALLFNVRVTFKKFGASNPEIFIR